MNVRQRLRRLEKGTGTPFADVLGWIRQGKYYDELTPAERQRYCDYRGSDRLGFEQVEGYFCGGLHVRLKRNPAPPTSAELEERQQYVERWYREAKEEYKTARKEDCYE